MDDKKRLQCCLDSDGLVINLRAIQGHSEGTAVGPAQLDNVEIPHGWREYIHHVSCSRFVHSIFQAGGKDAKEGRQTVFCTALDSMSNEPDEEYQDLTRPRGVQYKCKWILHQAAIYWINLRKVQYKGLKFWQTRSHAIILYDSVPADCTEKEVNTKTDVILCQRTPTPRRPPKVVLKGAWQVQRDDHSLLRSGIGKPIAEEERFKIDLRVQGVPPHKVVREDEDRTRRIRKLAHTMESQSRANALIADLQKTDTFNPISEESKHIIHNLGNVETFELCEVSAQTQCPSCAQYWPEAVLYCICGQCLLSSEKQKRMTKEV